MVDDQLILASWNSSVILGARSLAVPVAAGCSIVFKASELCPKTHHLLVTIFEKAGLPPGTINVIQTRREDAAAVTEALVAHPSIRKIEFIGSAGVGRIIGQLGGKYLKPVLMELGGKGPVIVLEDADLDNAADKCIAGGMSSVLTSQRMNNTFHSFSPSWTALLLYREGHSPRICCRKVSRDFETKST